MTRYYGGTSSRKGTEEDYTRCIVAVFPNDRWGSFFPHQCKFKRGYGVDELYCKRHAKLIEAGGTFWEGRVEDEGGSNG